ncbi:MAG: trypsin-like serine protease [Pseudomonadota bacterium]
MVRFAGPAVLFSVTQSNGKKMINKRLNALVAIGFQKRLVHLGVWMWLLLMSVMPAAHAVITFDSPDLYQPPAGLYTGTARLTITRTDGLTQLCSGAIVQPGDRVLTSAHCLTDDGISPSASSIEVAFDSVGGAPGATIVSTQFTWHPDWNGSTKTSVADIGAIQVTGAPAGVIPYSIPDVAINDQVYFELAGYGVAGKGAADSSLPLGTLRAGGNHYDDGSAFFTDARKDYLLYDFDDYTTANNLIGEPGWITVQTTNGPRRLEPVLDFDFDGVFTRPEAIPGGADSGGPSVIDNIFLVGIHSWGLNDLNGDAIPLAQFGDAFLGRPGSLVGDVPVARYADWVANAFSGGPSASVPEPSNVWLLGLAGLLLLRARRPEGVA